MNATQLLIHTAVVQLRSVADANIPKKGTALFGGAAVGDQICEEIAIGPANHDVHLDNLDVSAVTAIYLQHLTGHLNVWQTWPGSPLMNGTRKECQDEMILPRADAKGGDYDFGGADVIGFSGGGTGVLIVYGPKK